MKDILDKIRNLGEIPEYYAWRKSRSGKTFVNDLVKLCDCFKFRLDDVEADPSKVTWGDVFIAIFWTGLMDFGNTAWTVEKLDLAIDAAKEMYSAP
jgi:hypothetical protein